MTTKQNLSDVIPAMFISAAIAMIFTNLVDYVSVLIDGIITSRLLGHNAYSAIALFNPLNGLLLLISNAVSTGSHVIISQYVGTGDKDRANSVFSVTLLIMAIAASVITILWLLFPD
ncbi:MAG: hypothetical protein IJS42_02710, partial [Synergistaceae bacterium]|nr:hypothetical protein [Synergistaceae bacterium]